MDEFEKRVIKMEGKNFECRLSKHAVQRVAKRLLGVTRPELYARWGDPPIIKLKMPHRGKYTIEEDAVKFRLGRSTFVVGLASEEDLETVSDCKWVLVTYYYRI
jgi:hypothetical protein